MNQGFESDESVENDDQPSPERVSGEHSLYMHSFWYHVLVQNYKALHPEVHLVSLYFFKLYLGIVNKCCMYVAFNIP